MDIITLLILSLATWRISSLLTQEDGPYQILLTIRLKTQLFDCVWCMSVWVGLIISAGWLWQPLTMWLCLPFALSAIAIMIDRWSK